MGKIIKLKNIRIPVKLEIKNFSKTWNRGYMEGGYFEYSFDVFINNKKNYSIKNSSEYDSITDVKKDVLQGIIN